MRYIFKAFFLLYIVIHYSIHEVMSYKVILLIMLITAVNIFKERLYDSIYPVLISFAIISAAAYYDASLGVLLGITIFDLVLKKLYVVIFPVVAVIWYFIWDKSDFPMIILNLGISGLLAYIVQYSESKENKYKSSLDDERRLRYELEQTKMKLLNSAKDIAYLAEVKERNRIAREIHDNVGHSIAGIFIQLQASYKLFERDGRKSKEIMKKSIDSLADAVTLLRDTVHNIKPVENLGTDYIRYVIDKFGFCPVDFQFTGDFNLLPPSHMGVLVTNIKEALTNAAKHSRATNVNIKVDMNERFTRLYIRDNGIGCPHVKEGLGISGMKERIENMGGTFSVSSNDGFIIVCLIPREAVGGGIFNESSDCR